MKNNKSYEEQLRLNKSSLINAKGNSQIYGSLEGYGYNINKIDEGISICEQARQAFEAKAKKEDKARASSNIYKKMNKDIRAIYNRDKKKAKIIFTKDDNTLNTLGFSGKNSRSFSRFLINSEHFYKTITNNDEIRSKLLIMKITPEHISSTLDAIRNLHEAHTKYMEAAAESQNATKIKSRAFKKSSGWMFDFRAVAKISMEDNPQLLEALGIFVKS